MAQQECVYLAEVHCLTMIHAWFTSFLQMLKAVFWVPLLSFWRKGRKYNVYLPSYQERLPDLLEPVSLINNVGVTITYNSWRSLQKKHSLSDHLLGHHLQALGWHHVHSNKASQHFAQMCSQHFCLNECFQFLPAVLEKRAVIVQAWSKTTSA